MTSCGPRTTARPAPASASRSSARSARCSCSAWPWSARWVPAATTSRSCAPCGCAVPAPAKLAAFTLAEAAWPVLAGAVVGVALASAAAAVVASSTGSPVGPVVRAGLTGSVVGLAVLLPLAVASVAVALRARPGGGEPVVWHAVEIAAAVLAGAALLVAARGGTSAGTGRTDPLLVALPLLVITAAALLAARLAPPLLRLAARALPHRALTARTAVQGPVRRPVRAATTVAVLAATVGAVVFATGYRATLQRGAEDQAAYAVPTTAVLRTGPDLARPVDVATGPAVAALGQGVQSYPVLRTDARSLSGAETAPVQMLGVDPAALPAMARWRDDYSDRSRARSPLPSPSPPRRRPPRCRRGASCASRTPARCAASTSSAWCATGRAAAPRSRCARTPGRSSERCRRDAER